MSSSPNISPITATPRPDGFNAFEDSPDEVVGEISSRIDDPQSQINFEGTCQRFAQFTTSLLKARDRFFKTAIELALREEMYIAEKRLTDLQNSEGVEAFLRLPVLERVWTSEDERRKNEEADAFYLVFKQRAKELHLKLGEKYNRGLMRLLDESKLNFDNHRFRSKAQALKTKCFKKAINDLIGDYASQDIKTVTIDSFFARYNLIFMLSSSPFQFIGAMRVEIKKQKNRTEQIDAMRQELLAAAQGSPLWLAARAACEAKLIREKTALEADLLELDGKLRMGIDVHDESAYYNLLAMRNRVVIDEFGTGPRTGGRLFDIENELSPLRLDVAATDLIQGRARFYEELNADIDVSEEEASERDRIILHFLKEFHVL